MAQDVLYRKKSGPGLLDPAMRNFTLLWIGQLVSLVGSGMTCFAQSVSVYTDLGGTITHLTLLAVAAQLPGIFVSPLAGVLADRWDRRKIMIASDAVAALVLFHITDPNFSDTSKSHLEPVERWLLRVSPQEPARNHPSTSSG